MRARKPASVVVLALCAAALPACHRDAALPAAVPRGSAATVIVFLATDCPISTRYLPELARLGAEFRDRGVAFAAVYPNARDGDAAVHEQADLLGAAFAPLRDASHAIVRAVTADTTPETVVLDARDRVLYRGRIDDRYADFGRMRAAATRHDLEDAIAATLAGSDVTAAPAPPIGCAIAPTADDEP